MFFFVFFALTERLLLVPCLPVFSWANQRLGELLRGVEFETSESTVKVAKVEKLAGDAEVKRKSGLTI